MCLLCKDDGKTDRHPGRPVVLTSEERVLLRKSRSKAWKDSNPDRMKFLQRRAWLRWKYGLTLEQYERMLEAQKGGCAICTRSPEENGSPLSVDHCHKTKRVRGLLCKTCNRDVGRIEKHREGFARYLEKL